VRIRWKGMSSFARLDSRGRLSLHEHFMVPAFVGQECPTHTELASLLIQVSPVRADAHVYLQRNCQSLDFFHLLADYGLHCVDFVFGDFED